MIRGLFGWVLVGSLSKYVSSPGLRYTDYLLARWVRNVGVPRLIAELA